ncbi:MAG: sulfatase-like hydrolase/transferase [Clostridiaceae bacterium]|nr:sulfatase-like hydrolase/transferase [Clostridiaceae bacterium]
MMNEKVLLILVDGMRPDSLETVNHPFVRHLLETGAYTGQARSVMPSVTLPCHMSLFHSVAPDRHGVLTNTYTPQVRPINGLCEQLRLAKKTCGFFYNWGELKDLAKPDSLAVSFFASGHIHTYQKANQMVTDEAINYISGNQPDFAFLYLGYTDEAGHGYGWMTEPYLQAVSESWDCIERVVRAIPDDYTILVTADHGGHERSHGTDMPEDMTIPLFIKGRTVPAKLELDHVSILDIAPTIARLIGVEAAEEWEGKALV